MNIWWRLIFLSIFLLSLGFSTISTSTKAFAHGARITYTINMTVNMVATYDTGEAMAGAQFTVYAPDNPTNPWLTGICDDQGRFSFTPNNSMPGIWDVQVRKAGHGDIIHIPIGSSSAKHESAKRYTIPQISLMSICVIWGFIGTGLYLIRRRN